MSSPSFASPSRGPISVSQRKEPRTKMSQSKERSEKFERGLKTRRAVVGDAYVDKSIASADDFTWPMQVLVTENCWADTWNRPGLDRRRRSILNLGKIAALNRTQEMRTH